MTIWTQNCAVIDTGNQPFLVMVNKGAENSYSIDMQLGNMPIQVAEYDTEESAFEELKDEGVILYYGISSIRPNVIREYVKRSSIVSVMMQSSILDRRPEEEVLPLLAENNISVVTRGPVAKGLLSPKYRDKLTEKGYLNYSGEELKEVLQTLEQKFLDKRTLTEAAIQYNLAQPAVASIIAGASSVEQLHANANAVNSAPLTAEELAFIQKVSKASVYEAHR